MLRRDTFEQSLVIYPESVWNALMDEMRAKLSRWDRKEQMVFRMFVSGVTGLSVDANGRILIPKSYLEVVGIDHDIRFVGMGDTIEVWPAGKNDTPLMSQEEFGDTLQQLMRP